ncbi:hypothetical protein H8S90_16385 [Olivibacter sp. SDN3]|uniref:hypothetical protein n=1 Tax=Olivibacter sp. SDN3 TaxID=2764720 RepID=UPI0016514255|nr:hypothetical protein [Olivibacter sp. SDN3]QNL48365.1 hypothetical protein H8S90_16385 [Olivibacter sp. SDN3]
MEITMKEPGTEMDVTLQVVPEDYNGEQGLRIIYPSKDFFVMTQKGGEWKVVDEEHISPWNMF